MTNKIFTVFEILCIISWVAGMFAVGVLKGALWALPAGYGAGMIFVRWFFIEKKIDKKAKLMGVIDSKTASPEMKKAMEGLISALKDDGKIPDGFSFEQKKCDDPHCPACWGLAGNDEKQI